MPFSRPTRSTLVADAKTDMAAALGLTGLLRQSPEAAMAIVLAGQTDGLYGLLDWVAKQAVPFTSRGEFLEAWGALKGVPRVAAVAAAGTWAGTGTAGTVLLSGTPLVRAADGVAFTTTAGATVASDGTVTAPALAVAAGAAGNCDVGAVVQLGQAVPGINATGAWASTTTTGADAELEDPYFARVMAAFASPPQGGAGSDYVGWALAVAGVTRAWVTPNGMGAGTVVVYVMLDDVRSGAGGFPSGTGGVATLETRDTTATGDLLTVADSIFPKRNATALVYLAPPLAQAINPHIANLNDPSLQSAINAAMADMLRLRASVGGSVYPANDGTIYPSDISAAIASVPGVTHFTLSSPSAPVAAATGYLHTLGTPVYS